MMQLSLATRLTRLAETLGEWIVVDLQFRYVFVLKKIYLSSDGDEFGLVESEGSRWLAVKIVHTGKIVATYDPDSRRRRRSWFKGCRARSHGSRLGVIELAPFFETSGQRRRVSRNSGCRAVPLGNRCW